MIPLREFEFHIPERILQRGIDYLEKGLVGHYVEIENEQYEFLVLGSEEYVVKL